MRIFLAGLFFIPIIFLSHLNAETAPVMPSGWVDDSGGEISSLAELRWLSETPDAWDEEWVQIAHINASDTRTWNVVSRDSISGKDTITLYDTLGFNPIGNYSVTFKGVAFTGNYDGQHYKLTAYILIDQTHRNR